MEKQLQRWEENRFSGKTDSYWYTQTESSICVRIPLPAQETRLKSKDVSVRIESQSFCVKVRDKTIVEGNFVREFVGPGKPLGESRKINVIESLWTLEDGAIVIEIEKRKAEFWPNFLDGETKLKS